MLIAGLLSYLRHLAEKCGYEQDRINRFFTAEAVDRLQYAWYDEDKQAVVSQDDFDLDDILSSQEDHLFDLTALCSEASQPSDAAIINTSPSPAIAVGNLLGESDLVTTFNTHHSGPRPSRVSPIAPSSVPPKTSASGPTKTSSSVGHTTVTDASSASSPSTLTDMSHRLNLVCDSVTALTSAVAALQSHLPSSTNAHPSSSSSVAAGLSKGPSGAPS